MILIDTSVWIEHFRQDSASLREQLGSGAVVMHPFVLGELACGNLKDRGAVLRLLSDLPRMAATGDEAVLSFIASRQLMGTGIGYIDAHLLAAAVAAGDTLWTNDLRLRQLAAEMPIAFVHP